MLKSWSALLVNYAPKRVSNTPPLLLVCSGIPEPTPLQTLLVCRLPEFGKPRDLLSFVSAVWYVSHLGSSTSFLYSVIVLGGRTYARGKRYSELIPNRNNLPEFWPCHIPSCQRLHIAVKTERAVKDLGAGHLWWSKAKWNSYWGQAPKVLCMIAFRLYWFELMMGNWLKSCVFSALEKCARMRLWKDVPLVLLCALHCINAFPLVLLCLLAALYKNALW